MHRLHQMTQLQHVFVYGTLKKGQCREKCWPIPPDSIQPAWTVGELYDLGPYPAMVSGSYRIAGQVWSYALQDILTVTQVLDQIEVTNQPGMPNEYDRSLIQVRTLDDQELTAWTYHYSDPDRLKKFARLVPPTVAFQESELVIWPVGSLWT